MSGVLECESLSGALCRQCRLVRYRHQRAGGQDGRPGRRQWRRQIDAGQCVRRLVARPRHRLGRGAAGRAGIEGLAAHQRVARGLTLVPEGKNIFTELTVDENLALVRPPVDITGRHTFTVPEVFDFFPRLAERRDHKGVDAVGRRTADAGDRPRAARGPARADARRAVGRPCAAPDLRSVVAHPPAGRSRPAGAAGRTERQGGAQGGRSPLSARARPDRR